MVDKHCNAKEGAHYFEMQKKYWRTEYKFGVRIPKTVEEALQIDKATGTTHWEKALKKEMAKVSVAYKSRKDVTPDDVRKGRVSDMLGFQEIKCHIVFDVRMDFTRKARFVAGGHMTQPATSITYSSVDSRDSVAFLLAALNGLQVLIIIIITQRLIVLPLLPQRL
jgi:hypothetical protein